MDYRSVILLSCCKLKAKVRVLCSHDFFSIVSICNAVNMTCFETIQCLGNNKTTTLKLHTNVPLGSDPECCTQGYHSYKLSIVEGCKACRGMGLANTLSITARLNLSTVDVFDLLRATNFKKLYFVDRTCCMCIPLSC